MRTECQNSSWNDSQVVCTDSSPTVEQSKIVQCSGAAVATSSGMASAASAGMASDRMDSGRPAGLALARADMSFIVAARNGTPPQPSSEKRRCLTWASARETLSECWIIDPLKVSWPAYWDLAATLALLYTAIVTPVEVAFVQAPSGDDVYNTLFWANRVIDIIFLIDMALQFRLAVRVTGSDGTRWLHTPKEIARAYVTSKWFWLDLFSILTSIFDFPIFGDDDAVKNLVALRAVRILRLAKLIRLARGSRILKRWEMRVSINYSYLSLANVMTIIVIGCHWVACVWGLQASFAPLDSWMAYLHVSEGEISYCIPWAEGVDEATGLQMMSDPAACGPGPRGSARHCDVGVCEGGGVCTGGYNCAGWGELYSMALFYAISSVSGVGSMIAKPYNVREQCIAGLVHLATGICMCACMCGHVHLATGICMCACMCGHVHLATGICMCACMCGHLHLATGMLWAYLIGVFTSLA